MWEIALKYFIVKMVLIAQKYQFAEKIIHVHTLKNVTKKVDSVSENKFVILKFKNYNNQYKVCL